MKFKIAKIFFISLFIFSLLSTDTIVFADDNTNWEQYYKDQLEKLTEESKDREEQSIKNESKPNIKLVSPATFSVNAGNKLSIDLELQNITTYTANNIYVQASLASSDDMPFTLKFLNSSNYIAALGAKSKATVQLVVDVDSLAEAKRYDINLEYSYINSYKEAFTGKDTLNIKVENTAIVPKVTISDFRLSKDSIEAEEIIELTATLKNLGKQPASDVQLTVDGLSTDTISITNNANSLFYDKLEPESSSTIIFNISAAKDIKEGNYPLTFKITYKDSAAKEYTSEQKYFVKVKGKAEEEKPFLQIQNLTVPSEASLVGENFVIHLDIVNNGKEEAKNVKVSTDYGTDGAIIPKSTSIQLVNSLAAGDSAGFDFTFAATSTAKSQNYPISFKLEYEDGTKDDAGATKIISYSQYTGINISNPEADKKESEEDEPKSIPKIIISKYSCDPIMVKAGEEFNLHMTFTNTHSEKKVSNIKIFFSVPAESKTGNIFIPVDSSNTFYIDEIAPKGSVNKDIRLFAMPDAEPKTYDLIVNFDYEDETGALPAATETIGINVKQPTKLETSDIYIPDTGNVGEPIPISFSLYNTGKVTLSNLRVRITGDFDTQNSDTYYGNFESGNNEYYDGTIIPNASGKQNGQLVISYDEPNGERKEDIREISLSVADAPQMDAFAEGMPLDENGMPMDMSKMQNPQKSIKDYMKSPWTWVAIIAVVVIIGVALKFIKRRKQQKGMDLDD